MKFLDSREAVDAGGNADACLEFDVVKVALLVTVLA